MNRKLLNGLLAVAIVGAGCSGLTSCKDTEDDIRTECRQEVQGLLKKLELLQSQVSTMEQTLATCKSECASKIAELTAKFANYVTTGDFNNFKLNDYEVFKQDVYNRLNNLPTGGLDAAAVTTIIENILSEKGYLTDGALADYVTKAELGDVEIADIVATVEEVANLTTNIDRIETTMDDLGEVVSGLDEKYDGEITTINQTIENITNNYNTIIQDLESGKYGLTQEEVETLIDTAIATLQSEFDTLKQDLTNSINGLNSDITDLQSQIDALKGQMHDPVDISELQSKVSTLETQYTDLEGRVSTLETTVAEIEGIKTRLDDVESRLSVTEQKAIDAYTKAEANETKLGTMETTISGIQALLGDCEGLDPIADEIRDLKTKYTTLSTKLESVESELNQKITDLTGRVDGIEQKVNTLALDLAALTQRVAANEQAIAELQDALQKLTNRVDALITGVIVQGTYNPLFGNFALPIGVQSNMLVNYSGQSNNQTYTFPSVQSAATFNNENQITADELRMLEASNYVSGSIENGAILLSDKNANLGKVFVTINPNNINFAGKELQLVNSRDEASKVVLRNLRPSQELLTFGYSARGGGNNNGFYEADAYLAPTEEAIGATAIRVNENLKSTMKDILKDKRSNLRSNIVSLMKAVYDQINGALPAYALKAAWDVNDESFAVYSNYNIAATTFTPLSFGFLYDKSINRELPTIDPLKEVLFDLDPGKYKFDFSNIDFGIDLGEVKLEISFDDIELSYDGSLTVTVTSDVLDLEGKKIGTSSATGTVSKADLDAFLKKIQEDFNKKIGTWNTSIQTAYRNSIESVMGKVDEAVEKLLKDMESDINDKIEDMVNDIQDEVNGKFGSYIGKFNDFIERYNRLANRVNGIFENPNHYLQPVMLYKGGNGVHFLSTNASKPTVFHKNGGSGIMLYATSYTGEVIAPAYEKFIACTNVIENATGKSAQANGGELLDDLKTINGGEFMANVRPGDQRRFALPAASMKAGRTYEILYTAVDYHGVTSTVRGYIKVVD